MIMAPPSEPTRRDDLRVAVLHLRMGQLTLARAELEDLLRHDALGIIGYAALAEARWRTGDGALAADAAFAHLEGGGNDDVALCIAAEAVAADGRPAEARLLMDRVSVADATALDALFAGMPRRAFWPAGPVDRQDPEELRRVTDARTSVGGRPVERPGERPADPEQRESAAPSEPGSDMRSVPGPREVIDALSRGKWPATALAPAADATPDALGARPAGERQAHLRRARAHVEPAAELARARDELATKPERALLRLSLVLRHDPTLAPTVLELLRLRRDPMAALVRGDAQRLLGRHLEAEAAFDAAADSLEIS
jgi:hypothetical protein